ncbi:putative aldo keto reductase [Lyophyllum shimeji]|uniref:Aldo keto reductase n=1 Tax=Lyophyllum shimeji TaxID=47721 RepID=A0A9P3PZN8_LYOSH|nr:putative aldo keto reductase [Lyophyllum shimeji]
MSKSFLPTRKLGKNSPTVSALGKGAFYGKADEKECFDTLTYAADRGMMFWDTAVIYGGSEKILGEWFAKTGRRSEIFLATKFGAMDLSESGNRHKPNSKPSYIAGRTKKSLADLQTDYVDLYYQHPVDPQVPIEVVMEALRPFVRAKAVKGVGEKVIAAQMEYNPFELTIEKNRFVDAINEAGMAVVAYSPLARGLLTGRFRSPKDFGSYDYRSMLPRFSAKNFPKNLKIVDELQKIGEKYNASTSQITLAWILAEHPNFIPIPDIRKTERLEGNARATELNLSA